MAGHEIEKGEVNVQTPTERLHDDIRKNNEEEKDCTDQLLECTSECDINDSECESECVEEYKECELPWEEDEQMTYENEHDEGELIAEMLTLTALLGGTMERCEVTTSDGQSYKKIIIEYDIKQKDE